MSKCFQRTHAILQVNDHRLAKEVDHIFVSWTILVPLQLDVEVECVVNYGFWRKGRFTRANEVHYAAE